MALISDDRDYVLACAEGYGRAVIELQKTIHDARHPDGAWNDDYLVTWIQSALGWADMLGFRRPDDDVVHRETVPVDSSHTDFHDGPCQELGPGEGCSHPAYPEHHHDSAAYSGTR